MTGERRILHLLVAFGLLLPGVLAAQRFEQRIAPFPVERTANDRYLNPFSGGLIQPRIGLLDADGDGLPDLFALNPDNRLRFYHNLGNRSFRRVHPSGYDSANVRGWFRLADIDADGDLDLLTSGDLSEVLLYHNQGTSAQPVFPRVPDTLRTTAAAVIYTQQETVPSLVDIDADGDLDLFIGDPTGTIIFYRNVGTAAAPAFVLETRNYMGILVISGGRARKDDATILHHGASVLDFADIDRDGDLDILFGDFFTERLLLFDNGGTTHQAAFSMSRLDTAFRPNGDDVRSQGFNQPVAGDIDGDGDLDILISSLYPDATEQPVILYENTSGTAPGMPAMRRRDIDLTSELDLGTFAAPAGIHDTVMNGMVVGMGDGSIYYIPVDTTGGATVWHPAKRYSTGVGGLFDASPAVGDLDGDGVAELVIGDADGVLRLFRFANGGLAHVPWQLDTFKVNAYAAPALADIDHDGDLDLFIGAGNGRFVYFENTGGPAAPRFERRTPPAPFDLLDVGSNSVIRFHDIDRDGALDAVVGAWPSFDRLRGTVRFYLGRGDTFAIDPALPDIATDADPVPVMVNLPEGRFLIVGQRSGGMLAFFDRTSPESGAPMAETATGAMTLAPTILRGDDRIVSVGWNQTVPGASLGVYDFRGDEIMRQPLPDRGGTIRLRLPKLPAGVYMIAIGGISGKIIVLP
ncbi:MAG: repeat protein [Chlorobi bacterium]|nr:repeat protein [Chlorobiota bacterium]